MSFIGSKKLVSVGVITLIIIGILFSYYTSTDVVEIQPTTIAEAPAEVPAEVVNTEPVTEKASSYATETIESEEIQSKPAASKDSKKEPSSIASDTSTVSQESTDKPPIPVKPAISFVEGEDYITKFPNEQPKNPVLVEFFSYMCPHCFNFEPTLTRWEQQKPDSVELLRIPVTFGRTGSWGLAAKSYYIAKELQLEKEFSKLMFRKIHIDKKPPRNESDIGKIFLSLGIDDKAFKKAANSFNVNSNVRKADFLVKKYKVSGVPYFLINKKYETGKDSYESEQTLFSLWNNLPGKDF